MISPSKHTHKEIQGSEDQPIELGDRETNSNYLVTIELSDHGREVLYESAPLTHHEKRELMLHAGLRAEWDDPEMDVYNDLDPRR